MLLKCCSYKTFSCPHWPKSVPHCPAAWLQVDPFFVPTTEEEREEFGEEGQGVGTRNLARALIDEVRQRKGLSTERKVGLAHQEQSHGEGGGGGSAQSARWMLPVRTDIQDLRWNVLSADLDDAGSAPSAGWGPVWEGPSTLHWGLAHVGLSTKYKMTLACEGSSMRRNMGFCPKRPYGVACVAPAMPSNSDGRQGRFLPDI